MFPVITGHTRMGFLAVIFLAYHYFVRRLLICLSIDEVRLRHESRYGRQSFLRRRGWLGFVFIIIIVIIRAWATS